MGRQWCLRHRRQNRHGKLVRCVAHDVHLRVRMLVVCTTGFYHQEKEDQDLGLRTGGKACIVLGVFDRLGEEVAGAIAPPSLAANLAPRCSGCFPGGYRGTPLLGRYRESVRRAHLFDTEPCFLSRSAQSSTHRLPVPPQGRAHQTGVPWHPPGKHPEHLGARSAAISAAQSLQRLLHRVDRIRQELYHGLELCPRFSTQDPGLPSPGGRIRSFGILPVSVQEGARHEQRSVPASRGGIIAGDSSDIAVPLLAVKMQDNL
jgi:hypothetical protein